MIEIEVLLMKARELQPLPASTLRLVALSTSKAATLDEIADVIAYDQALTLRLLRSANSAFESVESPVVGAREAVLRLGIARVLALSVATAVNPLLKRNVAQYGLAEGDLWRHSVASAAAAEVLPEFCSGAIPIETFTAALLHDVGKLVMGRFLSTEILEVLQHAKNQAGLDPCAAETQVLCVNHAELGGYVAQNWGLPEPIARGIIYHHNPGEGHALICDAVCVANAVAKCIETEKEEPVVPPEVLERLGLEPTGLAALRKSTARRFQDISERYGGS